MNLIKVLPDSVINDSFLVRNSHVLTLLQKLDSDEVYNNFNDDNYVFDANHKLHQSAFLQVVTETVFEYPHNSYSEKTWKPIVNLRPFVLAGVPGSLKDLQDFGFKTFNNWWDESYDNVINSDERLIAIADLVQHITSKPIEELQKLLIDMGPILEHNRNHYYGEFKQYWTDQIHTQCQQNLLTR